MDRFGRRLGCALVAFLGLASSPFVFAQSGEIWQTSSAAMAACSTAQSAWLARGSYGGIYTSCVVDSCFLDESNLMVVARFGRSSASDSCYGVNDFVSYFSDNSIPYSGAGFTGSRTGRIEFDFVEVDEPDPVECEVGRQTSGWKAPTPNGTGLVCLSGCEVSISLSPPPGPLYVGEYTGDQCLSDTPDPLPVSNNDLPTDPDAPGTDEPNDPDAPPDTGGGGFTCDSPPVCNADGISCSMLYQQWRTRCDAQISDLTRDEKLDRIGDGLNEGFDDIGRSLGGIGDSLDGIDGSLDGIADGIGDINAKMDGIGDTLDGIGDGVGDLNSKVDGIFGDGEGVGDDWGLGGLPGGRDLLLDSSSLDDSGFGMSRSCPAVLTEGTTFSFFGNQYTLKFEMFCAMLELVGQILVVLAAFVGVRILLRSVQ